MAPVGFGNSVGGLLQFGKGRLLADPGREHGLQFGLGNQGVAADAKSFDLHAQGVGIRGQRYLRHGLRRGWRQARLLLLGFTQQRAGVGGGLGGDATGEKRQRNGNKEWLLVDVMHDEDSENLC